MSIKASATTTYTLKLTKGVFLNVRVSDPAHLLPAVKDTPLSAANLIVGVKFGNGAYLGAQNAGVDATGRSYQMVVPAGMPLRLWLFSRHVELSDTGGNVVDMTGGMLPFQPTAGVDHNFTFAVTGVLGQTH